MLLNLGMAVSLTSSTSEDYEVKAHPYRDDIRHTIKIGHVLTMNRAAQQDQFIDNQTCLARQHGNTATMTVRKKMIQATHIVCLDPGSEILSAKLTSCIIVSS